MEIPSQISHIVFDEIEYNYTNGFTIFEHY